MWPKAVIQYEALQQQRERHSQRVPKNLPAGCLDISRLLNAALGRKLGRKRERTPKKATAFWAMNSGHANSEISSVMRNCNANEKIRTGTFYKQVIKVALTDRPTFSLQSAYRLREGSPTERHLTLELSVCGNNIYTDSTVT